MRIRTTLLALAVAGTFTLATTRVRAAVAMQLLDETRSVSVTADAANFSGVKAHQADAQQATAFDAFEGFVTRSAVVGSQASGPGDSAIAQQSSALSPLMLLDQGQVTADANFNSSGSGVSLAESDFQVKFLLAQPTHFAVTADITGVPDFNNPGNSTALLSLTDSLGVNAFTPQQTINVPGFQTSGTLAAGMYTLKLNLAARSDDESFNRIDYNMQMTAAAIPMNDPVAVALPPAGLSAAMTLVLLLAFGRLGRLRRINSV